MKSDVHRTSDGIARLPHDFRELGNIAFGDLLRRSGYYEIHQNVSEADIAAALSDCRDCVGEWIQYAAGKRTSGGWYLEELESGQYEVGCVSGGEADRRVYASAVTAIFEIIISEIGTSPRASLSPRQRSQSLRSGK